MEDKYGKIGAIIVTKENILIRADKIILKGQTRKV